jgi:predicted ester cyclase
LSFKDSGIQDGRISPKSDVIEELSPWGTSRRNPAKTESLRPGDFLHRQRGFLTYDESVVEPSIGETAVKRDAAWNLANDWVTAWNGHDLDSIMSHYEDEVELTSPVAAQLLGTSDGKVVGKVNLRAYFQRGLQAYPELHFRLEDVLWGVNSVLLYYTNQKGTRTGEFMELSATGKVARVVANYNA